jgi:glutamate-1-semialdehyde 2,1-aminomutase
MFSVFFTATAGPRLRGASTQDTAAYAAFFHAMLDAGVHLPPSAYEAWFLSAPTTTARSSRARRPARRRRGGRRPGGRPE